jgi:hypothetical protein
MDVNMALQKNSAFNCLFPLGPPSARRAMAKLPEMHDSAE